MQSCGLVHEFILSCKCLSILGLIRLDAITRLQDGFIATALKLDDTRTNTRFGNFHEVEGYTRRFLISCRYELFRKSLTNRKLYKRPLCGDTVLRYIGNSSFQYENRAFLKSENDTEDVLFTHTATVVLVGKIFIST